MNASSIKSISSTSLTLLLTGGLLFCLLLSVRNHNVLLTQDQAISTLQEEISEAKTIAQALELSIKEISSRIDKTADIQSRTSSQLNDLTKQNSHLQQEVQNTKDQQDAAQKDSKKWQVEYVTTLVKMENTLKHSEEQIALLKTDSDLLKIEMDTIDIADIRRQILQLKQNLETMARAFSARDGGYIPQALHQDLLQN